MNAKFLKSVILIVVIAITSTASTFAEIKIRQQLDMQGNYITNLAYPTKPDHAVTKVYVDEMLDVTIPILPKPGNQPGEIGLAWPDPRFTDNGNGTVTDNLTGLMWTKNAKPRGSLINWNSAIDWCEAYVYAGHSDWRLPNVNELSSLVNYSQVHPADWLNSSATPFTSVEGMSYYTSSTIEYRTDRAWRVVMGYDGGLALSSKTSNHDVWPVRTGH